MGVASGCGEQEAGIASGSGWNLWVVATGCGCIIDSRVKGLETDHVHTFALYIEPRAVNIAPFNTSYYNFPGYTTAGREVVQRLEPLSSRQQVKKIS